MTNNMYLDVLIFQYLNSFAGRNNIFDALVAFTASYLQYFVVAVTLFWFWNMREAIYQKMFTIAAAVILSRGFLTEAIRHFYPKPRPFEVLDVHQVVNHSAGGAFPSGHAAFFFALGAAIFVYDKKWGSGFLIAAGLISIARVIGGVHWPADILAGAAVGALSAALVYYGQRSFFKKGSEGGNISH